MEHKRGKQIRGGSVVRIRVRRRSSAILVLAIIAVLVGAGTAKAYSAPGARHLAAAAPAAAPSLTAPTVAPTATAPGGVLTVSGKGCVPTGPLTQVNVILVKPAGAFVAVTGTRPTAAGNWKASLTVPTATAPGAYKVESTCDQYVSAQTYPAVAVTVDSLYHALSPVALFDTRLGTGGVPKAPVAAGGHITVKVADLHGVPANATAVALNVTAVGATTATAITIWPAGLTRPATPAMYPVRAAPSAQFEIVSLHAGSVELFNAAGKINLAAAVAGYLSAPASFVPEQTPVALFDTRLGTGGVPKAPVAAGGHITVKVADLHGVPANATAVALNVTAVGATTATAITIWPAGLTRPATPAMYPVRAAPSAQFEIVSLHAGSVELFNAAGKINLAAAVAGYLSAPASFVPEQTPVALFDTRLGTGGVPKAPVAAGGHITVKVADLHGVPANATAVALNVTAVGATTATAITIWPAGLTRPATPAMYPVRAAPSAQFEIVSLHAGSVELFNAAGKINLAAAVAGYSN